MDTQTLADSSPAVQTLADLSTAWKREHVDADTAGLIVLHVKRSPSGDHPDVPSSIEIPVYVLASQIVSVEPSVKANGTLGGANVQVDGGSRRYVVESAEAVVSLLARMREAHRE